jgi:hypothetical protein
MQIDLELGEKEKARYRFSHFILSAVENQQNVSSKITVVPEMVAVR